MQWLYALRKIPKPRIKNTRNLTWRHLICIIFQNVSTNNIEANIRSKCHQLHVTSLLNFLKTRVSPHSLEFKKQIRYTQKLCCLFSFPNKSSYTHSFSCAMTLCFTKDRKPKPQIKDTRNLMWRHPIYIFAKTFRTTSNSGRSQRIYHQSVTFWIFWTWVPLTRLELKSKYIYPI